MIRPEVYERIVCAICGRDFTGHRSDNGECHVYARAEVKPYALRRRVKTPLAGWLLR